MSSETLKGSDAIMRDALRTASLKMQATRRRFERKRNQVEMDCLLREIDNYRATAHVWALTVIQQGELATKEPVKLELLGAVWSSHHAEIH